MKNKSEEAKRIKNYLSTIKPTLAGKFFYYCLPFRKKIVLQNLDHVFADVLTPTEIIYLAKCFYSHIATSIKENIAMRFMSQEAICQRAEVEGHEAVIELAKKQGGVLILTGHFGNWEFAPIAGILNFKQFKGQFHFIRKTLNIKWLEKKLFKRYYQSGLKVIAKKNSLMQVCEALEQQDAVVFVLDQHASLQSKDGILVDFFNKPAGTYRSLAMIARYTGAPVIPACSFRKPDGKHVLRFHPPIEWQQAPTQNEEILQNTLAYNRILEAMILEHPEQWLWMHKRWKVT